MSLYFYLGFLACFFVKTHIIFKQFLVSLLVFKQRFVITLVLLSCFYMSTILVLLKIRRPGPPPILTPALPACGPLYVKSYGLITLIYIIIIFIFTDLRNLSRLIKFLGYFLKTEICDCCQQNVT